jgi:hypothetical protein
MQKPLDFKCPHCGTAYQVVQVQTVRIPTPRSTASCAASRCRAATAIPFSNISSSTRRGSAVSNYWPFITMRSITMTCASCGARGNSVARTFRVANPLIRRGASRCMPGFDRCAPAPWRGHTTSRYDWDTLPRFACILIAQYSAHAHGRVRALRPRSRHLP